MNSNKKLSNLFKVETGLRLLNSIVSHKKQGIILMDLDGTIMFANSLINSVLRKGDETIRNTSMFKFVCPKDAVHITDIVSALISNNTTNSGIHNIRLKISDSIYQTFETYGIGIYSDAGMLECIELCLVETGAPLQSRLA